MVASRWFLSIYLIVFIYANIHNYYYSLNKIEFDSFYVYILNYFIFSTLNFPILFTANVVYNRWRSLVPNICSNIKINSKVKEVFEILNEMVCFEFLFFFVKRLYVLIGWTCIETRNWIHFNPSITCITFY